MPTVAAITVWWLIGFNVLLVHRRAYATSRLRSTKRPNSTARRPWTRFRRITWPLIWPVTVLVLTIQLILQLKIFDQVYLFSNGGRADATMVMVQYIFKQAFQHESRRPRGGGLGRVVRHHHRLLRAAISSSCEFEARNDGYGFGKNAPSQTLRCGKSRRLAVCSRIDLSSGSSSRWRPCSARHLGVSALLGDRDDAETRVRGGESRASRSGRAISRSKTIWHVLLRDEARDSGTSIRSITSGAVTVLVVAVSASGGLRDIAARVSRADGCSGG